MLDGRDFTVTGHSLGGGMASLISYKLNVTGTTFNAAGRKDEEKFNIPLDQKSNIDAYVINGEIIHCMQGKLGIQADGNMQVIPYVYPAPEFLPHTEAVNFPFRCMNHTIGQMRSLLKENNIK